MNDEQQLEQPRRLVSADDLDTLAAELVSLAIFTTRRPDADGSRAFYEQAARFEQQANHIGYPSLADGIGRAKKRDTWPERSEHLRQVAGRARELAGELRQDVDDDARRLADGDEQRDYAEERANAALLRDDDERPALGIGATLALNTWTAEELLEELETGAHRPGSAIARELGSRALELEELSGLALTPIMQAAARARRQLDGRPASVQRHELEKRAADLERAEELLRLASPMRRKILRQMQQPADTSPRD